AVVQVENRDIECAAAKVINSYRTVLFLIEAICKRSGCQLVHKPQDLEPRDTSSILDRLSLYVVKVGGNGDHGFAYRGAEVAFRVAFELPQDERGDLRRRESLITELDAENLAKMKIIRQTKGEEAQFVLDIVHAPAH